jgi:hypothetical protein
MKNAPLGPRLPVLLVAVAAGGLLAFVYIRGRAFARTALTAAPPAIARVSGAILPGAALRTAIQTGNSKAVSAALNRGASVNRVMPGLNGPVGGFTPLNAAVLTGNLRVVRLLLRRGADIEAGDGWYPSPLVAAVANDRPEMMRFLVAHGARVNDRRGGSRSLWVAATSGKIEAMTFLLAHGANKDTLQDGLTLLHALQAQGLGDSDAARLLRLRGATE